MDDIYLARQERYRRLHGDAILQRILDAPGTMRAEDLGRELGFSRQYVNQLYYRLTGQKWGYRARNTHVQA